MIIAALLATALTASAAPNLLSISPERNYPGTPVTLTGTNFGATQNTGQVRLGDRNASSIVSWSDTQIVAVVASGASSGNAQVRQGGVWSNSLTFTVITPAISSITPTSGYPGTQVTINGMDFGALQQNSRVKLGNKDADSIVSWSDTQIIATVASGVSSGSAKVFQGAWSNEVPFTVLTPEIGSITPTSAYPGTSITINGTNFGASQQNGRVKLGTKDADSIVSWSDTQIVATVASGAASGSAKVYQNGVWGNEVPFTVFRPAVSSIGPASAYAGTEITIYGTQFGASQGSGRVRLGDKDASAIVSWNDERIVAVVATGASSGTAKVFQGAWGNELPFTVLTPEISSVSPPNAYPGTPITIEGTSFGASQGSGRVKLGTKDADSIVSWSDTRIVAVVAFGASSGNAKVLQNGVWSNELPFTVITPAITSVSPASAYSGTQVTIDGTNFGALQGSGRVRLGSKDAGSIVSWSETQIVAVVASGALSGTTKVYQRGWSNEVPFTVLTPAILTINPTSGSPGSVVVIEGKNFGASQGSGRVKLGNKDADSIVSWSDTQIVATVASGASSGSVKVHQNGVWSNEVPFTIAPKLTNVSPEVAAAGEQVTLTGTNFGAAQGTGSVRLGSELAASVVSWSDTQIVAIVAAGSATGSAQVQQGGVTSNSLPFTVTITPPTLISVSPDTGATGDQVTLTGMNFGATQGTASVWLGNAPAGSIVTWSDTEIVATVSSRAGRGDAYVERDNITANLLPFTVMPRLVSVSPEMATGGDQVTLTGTSFGDTQESGEVWLGSEPAANIVSWSDTEIVAIVSSSTFTGDALVQQRSLTSNSLTFIVVPTLTGVSPATVPAGNPVTVTLTGTNFGATQGTVFLGSKLAASIVSWSNTQIVAVVDAGATTGSAQVRLGDGSASNTLPFVVTPTTLTSVSPEIAPPGAQITLTGTNFGASRGSGRVRLGDRDAGSIVSWNDTRIVATVAAGSVTGSAQVFQYGTWSNAVPFTIAPTLISVTPDTGATGDQVTLTGMNFGATQGTASVWLGNAAAGSIVSWSDTEIVATVSSRAGRSDAYVQRDNITTNLLPFTVTPRLVSVSPPMATGGDQVILTGTSFGDTQESGEVWLGSEPAASIVSWSDTEIVAIVSSSTVTGDAQVQQHGVTSNSLPFIIVPTLTGVSPATATAGDPVTLTGTNFGTTQGTVLLGTKLAASIESWSNTQIVAVVDAGANTGSVQVRLGGSASSTLPFVVTPMTLTSVSPAFAPVGAQITLTGRGFGATQGTGSVSLGSKPADSIVSWSNTRIVATVAAGSLTGSAQVFQYGTWSNAVPFTIAPTLISVSPATGATGDQVTLTGMNFGATQGTASVWLGNGPAGSIVSWSDTEIVATVSSRAGRSDAYVQRDNITTDLLPFTVTPRVVSISPPMATGGDQVTLTGTSFGDTQDGGEVWLGSEPAASIVSWSDTEIVAIVSSSTFTGDAQVQQHGVTSNSLPFLVVPTLTGVSPATATAGDPVTLTGTNFGTTQGTVLLGTKLAASIVSWSNTQIVAVVDAGANTGSVQVRLGGSASNTLPFVVTPMTLTSVSPAFAPVGAQITLTGRGFGATQGSGSVSLGGEPAASIVSWSSTRIVATVAAGSVTGSALVQQNGITSNSLPFTVTATALTLTSVSPDTAAGGDFVTLTGTNFGAAPGPDSVVWLGSAPARAILSWSDTQIIALVDAFSVTGYAQVRVGGLESNSLPFTVTSAPPAGDPPTLTSVSPETAAAGDQVTLIGTNFGATQGLGNAVLGSEFAASIVSWSDTQIVATVAATSVTGFAQIHQVNGHSNALSFFVMVPTLTSVSPSAAAAGEQVTLTGTNFGATQGTGSVWLGSELAGSIVSWSDTQIVATVASGSVSGYAQVRQRGAASNSRAFTVEVLELTSVSPVAASAGDPVTLIGTNFGATQGTGSVWLGSELAGSIVSWSDTRIVATVASGSVTGYAQVRQGGLASNSLPFTVAAIALTTISPAVAGPGHQVTLTGMNFGATQGTGSVWLGSEPAGSIVSWSDTRIVATIASGSVTGYAQVQRDGIGSNRIDLDVVTGPYIRSLSLPAAPVGTNITIEGFGFGASSATGTVRFGTIDAFPFYWSDEMILAFVPEGLEDGPAPVQVTTNGVSSNSVDFTVSWLNEFFIYLETPYVVGGFGSVRARVSSYQNVPPQGIPILLTSSDETAVYVPYSVDIEGGQLDGVFHIEPFTVTATTEVTITATDGIRTLERTLYVTPNGVSQLTFNQSDLHPGDHITGTVTLFWPAAAGGAVVELTSNSPALLPVPATVIVPEGQTEVTFEVTAGGPVTGLPYVVVTAACEHVSSNAYLAVP